MKALDHSSALRDPVGFARAAKDAGYAAVLRYLPIPAGVLMRDHVGRLNKGEVAAYHGAGLGIGIVWETTQMRPLDGATGGLQDGPAARAAANALGFPPNHPIFGAVDFDPLPPDWPLIAAYLGAAGFEPYGNGPLLTHLASIGFMHYWMHNWGGHDFGNPHIHQQGGQVTVAGISCDLNDVYTDDCLWWPPVVVTGGRQVLREGPNMRVDTNIPGAAVVGGRGWVDVAVPGGMAVCSVIMNGADALDGSVIPPIGWAARDIGGGKWRVNFSGLPGGCDLHIGLG
jgi:hypothetical protein